MSARLDLARPGILPQLGPADQPPHPFKALFTAVTISATSTCAPLGMPFGHAVASALPKAMFTIVRISSTVTVPLSLQSPTHGLRVAVGGTVCVGVFDGVAVGV